ncbi:protein phosphatase pp2a regulatory subunit B, putative [Entamoeba invadens IP1]|uniref:Serine/threonine-protein phosphatase 2A 55 kDa regulatory subunit B n=1 Tax=Entamoeba invadens IP1 TaxID=370355 RepID=A0A0A1U2E4_ENTIV|nr:protein phosphatase pp2a regulatory subunit B, putative [Entamoeba invadens IP1]ELP88246.1 protein phosphatase pp2a regulatory subunit B, putative [Entamoeba invadens IP1]|eukprot:XP_004255017.1 protein phosphatase pp2a regulatory subunit B, putative [Entamoeba invadens IP1]
MYSIDWRLTQVFGGDRAIQDDISDQDTVSTIEFSPNGDFLAAGDYGGRVVLFKKSRNDELGKVDFKFWTEFASHEKEFDCLRSMEIEEKINVVKFVHQPTDDLTLLLTTNDKTIKLWKTASRTMYTTHYKHGSEVPEYVPDQQTMFPEAKQTFGNNHGYPIHSLCPLADMETFLSADFLKINLWNYNHADSCYNLVEWNVDDSKELITCVEVKDGSDHIFTYGSSTGTVRLCDMRSTKTCSSAIKCFVNTDDYSANPQRQESFPSISSIKMTKDGNALVVRDYLSVRTFDLRKTESPTTVIPIHDHLISRFSELEANDVLYDKFDLSLDGTDQYCVTGSYDREFIVHDLKNKQTLPLLSHRFQPRVLAPLPQTIPRNQLQQEGMSNTKLLMKYAPREHMPGMPIDYSARVSLTRFHPNDNLIATAVSNNLYIFNGYYTQG